MSKVVGEDISFRIMFLGEFFGIGLSARGEEDSHICFHILVEDDENWFVSENGGSSFWLPDLQEQLDTVRLWMIKNADPDVVDGIRYGYKFRD